MTKKFAILILFLLGFFTSYRLYRPGIFSMQDDIHVFRLEQLDKCLSSGQFPCRYIPDGGLGYGYPLFNFYSPLPYYIGEIFHKIGFSYIDSIKIVFTLTSYLRPLGIFLLSSFFFGINGGLISAIIFSLAPYQAVNSYVRGAIAENLALALVPFVFYFFVSKKYLLFTLFVAMLSLTHNLTLLYTLPTLTLFVIIFYRSILKSYLLSLMLSIGLSSFFLLPAFFEKNLTTVNTMTQGYFYYVNHFATLKELFISRFWGYGASLWGPLDDMSFQIGYLQWLLPLFSLFFFKKTKIIFFFLIGLFALFLTHNKSTFLWTSVPLLPFYQFPWRFLGLAIFCFSLICGTLALKINKPIFVILILSVSLVLNFNYFKEDIWYPKLTDSEKLSGANLIQQSGAGLKDYWPKFSYNFPDTFAKGPEILSGTASINKFNKNSQGATGSVTVNSKEAYILLPVVYFPKMSLLVNDQPTPYLIDQSLGLITLGLNQGTYNFNLTFENTPIRFISNTISLVSLIIFLSLAYIRRGKKV